MKYRTILLFGAPGAGKGTQGKILGAIPSFLIAVAATSSATCGPNHRWEKFSSITPAAASSCRTSRPSSFGSNPCKDLTQSGRLHPERDTLVLDGIPRNVHQAEMLREVLQVVGVFYLCSRNFESLVNRIQRRAMKENRLDDANLDVIRQRLKTYEDETKPVLNFYGKKLVHQINADQSPAKVLADILRHAVNK